MHNGTIGAHVAQLQRLLIDAGFKLVADGWYGAKTEVAVRQFQQRAGLVADGIAGPKTLATLRNRDLDEKLLSEADLERAATRLGVPLAALKAINTVESNGRGFLDDGRPVILYERHIAYRLMAEIGADADALARRYPNVINPARGGYAGGSSEWSRLATARQVVDPHFGIPEESCSWGQFQIMGFHWHDLGYESIDAFVAAMSTSEAAQLDAFCRFIEAEPALIKALKACKWADFARLYNGPDYKRNLYDIKLARLYDQLKGNPDETVVSAV